MGPARGVRSRVGSPFSSSTQDPIQRRRSPRDPGRYPGGEAGVATHDAPGVAGGEHLGGGGRHQRRVRVGAPEHLARRGGDRDAPRRRATRWERAYQSSSERARSAEMACAAAGTAAAGAAARAPGAGASVAWRSGGSSCLGGSEAVGRFAGAEQPAGALPVLGLAGAGGRERHLDHGVLPAAGVDVHPVAHVDADVGDALAVAEGEQVAGTSRRCRAGWRRRAGPVRRRCAGASGGRRTSRTGPGRSSRTGGRAGGRRSGSGRRAGRGRRGRRSRGGGVEARERGGRIAGAWALAGWARHRRPRTGSASAARDMDLSPNAGRSGAGLGCAGRRMLQRLALRRRKSSGNATNCVISS